MQEKLIQGDVKQLLKELTTSKLMQWHILQKPQEYFEIVRTEQEEKH